MNARDGDEGERRYKAVGSPIVPSLVVSGRVFPILHPHQIASLLDLPGSDFSNDSSRLAWDTVAILESWLEELLPFASWTQMTKPTPSRGRTIRNLTVNTFHPYELLPVAWTTQRFEWYPEEDAQREWPITNFQELESYARKIFNQWQMFLMEVGEELERRDPLIESSRGEVTYSLILHSQRRHAAFHHRQVADFLAKEGIDMTRILDVEGFADIDLPSEVY